MSRKRIIAANWKMHKGMAEAVSFIEKLSPHILERGPEVWIAPPFLAVPAAVKAAAGTPIVIGAQNMHDADHGAFTGEISSSMLKEAGVHFVIVGHSERRFIFKEGRDFVARKLKKALSVGFTPILCVGETEDEHKRGKTSEVVQEELSSALKKLSAEEIGKVVFAYEPIWAIGTGMAATPSQIEEVHATVRTFISKLSNANVAKNARILYGGSVKPSNFADLLHCQDVDGALVGGAALEVDSFAKLIKIGAEA